MLHIFLHIIFYALGSTSWSSEKFWMVDRVITDPSLGLLSLCEVVPLVLILIIESLKVFYYRRSVRQGTLYHPFCLCWQLTYYRA
jgi:hypothetical protein